MVLVLNGMRMGKKYEGHFKNGKENGFVVKWSDSGEKIYEKKFLDGNEQ